MSSIEANRLAGARLRAAEVQPFLAVALYALTPVNAPGKGTLGVDSKWRLFVDPEVVMRWSMEELAGVLLHEVGHLVRDHHGRSRSCFVLPEEHTMWNVACDAEINDDLRDDRVALPDHPVFPETLGAPTGKAAEYYFHLLRSGQSPMPPEYSCCGAPLFDESEVALADQAPHLATGGLSEGEARIVRAQVAVAISQMLGRSPGTGPGGWERWANAELSPTVDWRTLLRSRIRGQIGGAAGSVDYSYARPSRRRIPGVILPSMQRPTPAVAIVVDVSGSVDDVMLGLAWSEVQGCLKAVGTHRDRVAVFAVDTEVRKVRRPHSTAISLTGGGGTDLGIGIDAALRERPRPDVVVVLTDGFTGWPEEPPPCRTIIVILENEDYDWIPPVPEWAIEVRVPHQGQSAEVDFASPLGVGR